MQTGGDIERSGKFKSLFLQKIAFIKISLLAGCENGLNPQEHPKQAAEV